jgi:hemerythrin superfamily protein
MAKKKKQMPAKKTAAKSKSRTAGNDILKLLLDDHKPLKRLIKVMKGEGEIEKKREAFEEFAPTLLAHAKPEEQSLYEHMKGNEELRTEGFEGDVEHHLADQLVEQIKLTDDEDVWEARVKVLAELVEHHIEEEEEEMFPDFRKETEAEERVELGEKYLQYRAKYETGEKRGGKDNRADIRAQH